MPIAPAPRLLLALAIALAGSAAPTQPPGAPPEPREGMRPRGRPFISPMGEPFRGTDALAPEELWFRGVDRNGDGRLTLAEFTADAARFFQTLDLDHDGEIAPDEIDHYEQEIAPEVRAGSGDFGGRGGGKRGGGGRRHGGGGRGGGGGFGGGGSGGGFGGGRGGGEGGGDDPDGAERRAAPPERPQGAARFGYLGYPEPVTSADADFNRGVSGREFVRAAADRFVMLDTNHDGVITRAELPPLPGADRRGPGRHPDAAPDRARGAAAPPSAPSP